MYQATQTAKPIREDRRPKILRPEDAAKAVYESGMIPEGREGFFALYLDSRHRLIVPPYMVSLGSINASLVHPREVFRPGVEHGAVAIIVAHNHPSGSLSPSSEDIELTARLNKAGGYIGITLLDHLILDTEGHSVSLRERGEGF